MAQALNANYLAGANTVQKDYAAAAKPGKATPSAKEVAYATGALVTKPSQPMGGTTSTPAVTTTPTSTPSPGVVSSAQAAAAAGNGNAQRYLSYIGQQAPSATPTDAIANGDEGNGFNTLGETTGRGGGGGGGYYRSGGGSSGGGGGGGSYTAPILPTATSQEAYIRSMYDANEQAARENLRAEYENNMAALDREAGRLPETYDTAVDAANTQAAINRLNFNEQAAMSGLNTGAGSQARLSQNNALLGNVSSIRRAQADAQADLDFQRTQMEAQYQQAIRDAVAKNDLAKAEALYQEAKRVDESIVNTAINQANLNWNIWRTLYG